MNNFYKLKFVFSIILIFNSCVISNKMNSYFVQSLPSIKNSMNIIFLEVPKGSFEIGCNSFDSYCDDDEKPSRKVKFEKTFYFSKYEVTVGEFRLYAKSKLVQKGKDTWNNCFGMKQTEDHPVICVNWFEAKNFANWLSDREGKRYRLPTQAEWEYVARSSTEELFPWGNQVDDEFTWYRKNSEKKTHPVGKKKPNQWGFHDMHGNVMEWCEDDYSANQYKNENLKFPIVLENSKGKILKGGSWFDSFIQLRASSKFFANPYSRDDRIGFRLVMEK